MNHIPTKITSCAKIAQLLLGICLLLLTQRALTANTQQAILQLDTKGHTGIVRDIIITQNKDIITASDDKTVRVWSQRGESGEIVEKRKILGQIGSGNESKIFAMTLSPKEQYLAVGGFINSGNNERIRIYHYPTGKLIQILQSHNNVVLDLAFDPHGKYLISGSSDKTAKIWRKERDRFTLHDTIEFHQRQVYATKIITNNNQYFAITASYDHQIALYDIQKRKIIQSDKRKYKLQFLATSHDRQHIAVSGEGKEIAIYDFRLKLVKTIASATKPSGLAYSEDGKLLIAGSSAHPLNVNIYQTHNNYTLQTSFQKHTNLTTAVGFINKNTAISAGGNNNEIYTWNTRTASLENKAQGVGSSVWSVGIRGDKVAWGNIDPCPECKEMGNRFGELQKSIHLKTFTLQDIDTTNYHKISTTQGNYSLHHTKGGDYGYSDALLQIKYKNQVKHTIVKDAYNGYRHNTYGWYKNYIVSGGSNGQLKIYNQQGKEIASLIGHTGDIWSIALQGDRLVSGGDDQNIKIWDLSVLDEGVSELSAMLSLFVSSEGEYVAWSEGGYFASSVGGDQYVGYHINQGADSEARYVGSDKYFDTLYRPDVIGAIWQLGSEKKALAYASKNTKTKSIDPAHALPPLLTLLSSEQIVTDKTTIRIRYSVESAEPITKTVVSVNGKRINKRALKLKDKSNIQTIDVELDKGENIVALKARNRFAFSDELLVYATKTSRDEDIYKPTLYLLSIGVSEYKNKAYDLAVADKDARAMTAMFEAQSGKIYKKVVSKTLLNSQANQDNILDGLDWLDKEATSKDVVVVFIAGHGVTDEQGSYYFLSHEADLQRLRRSAVRWSEIQATINNLPSKVILLADTCHSGSIAGNRRDITGAIKSIINSGSGSIIMTATTGSGYSYEQSDWGHGAFTKALLEGVGSAKADYDRDEIITIKEIDLYVTNRVKSLTRGKQKPTTIIPRSVPDFAIGVK